MLLLQVEDAHPEPCLSLRVKCCKVQWPVAYYTQPPRTGPLLTSLLWDALDR